MRKTFVFGIMFMLAAINITIAAELIVDNGYRKYDDFGNALHAHGGGILRVGDYYYWFGESRNYDISDTFYAVSCYRSKDLKAWEFRNHVLRQNMDTDLNFAKIERPKVIYNPSTKKYVMWMHKERGDHYGEARAAVASCDTIDGDYTYHGSFRPLGYMSRDCTLYVDDDGSAYFLSAANNNADLHLYRLADDFLSADYLVTKIWAGQSREAPCSFKRNGVYFIVTSGCTGWSPNQAKYGWATNLAGPWSGLSNLGSSSTSFESQPHYVLSLQGSKATSYLYMGDRWAKAWGDYTPRSRYVWMPLEFASDTAMSMEYYDALSIDAEIGSASSAYLNGWRKVDDSDASITYSGKWGTYSGNPGYFGVEHYSWTIGSQAAYAFTGTKARYYGFKRNDLGYANIFLDGDLVDTVDCYSSVAQYDVLLYESPELSNEAHILSVEVTGACNPSVVDKNGEIVVDAFSCYVLPSDIPPLQAGTEYRIMNRKSGKILTVGGGDKNADAAPLLQYAYANAAHQKWIFERQSDDTFLIRSLYSGKVADVQGSSLSNGASAVQNTDSGIDSQKWNVNDTGGGVYKIENFNSAKIMDIQNGSWDDGAQTIQNDDNGGDNQQWLLMPCVNDNLDIWIEAESASAQDDFSPFSVEFGGVLPEDAYIVVSNGIGNQSGTPSIGICEYQFTTEVYGNVRIRLLAHCPSTDDNSFQIQLNSEPYEHLVLQVHQTDFLWGHWTQRPLDAGTHTLSIAWDEDGAKLDKILIEIEPVLRTNYDGVGIVDMNDYRILSENWLQFAPAYDIAPEGGDGIIDFLELQLLAEEWLMWQ